MRDTSGGDRRRVRYVSTKGSFRVGPRTYATHGRTLHAESQSSRCFAPYWQRFAATWPACPALCSSPIIWAARGTVRDPAGPRGAPLFRNRARERIGNSTVLPQGILDIVSDLPIRERRYCVHRAAQVRGTQ